MCPQLKEIILVLERLVRSLGDPLEYFRQVSQVINVVGFGWGG